MLFEKIFCWILLKGSIIGLLKVTINSYILFSLIPGIHDNRTSAKIVNSNNLTNRFTIIIIMPMSIPSYLVQLNNAFELNSFFNSLVTSTLEGDNKYTLCSISCKVAPNT